MKNLVFAIMMMVCGISFAQDQFVSVEKQSVEVSLNKEKPQFKFIAKTLANPNGMADDAGQIPAGSILLEQPISNFNYSYLAVPMPLNLDEAYGFVPVEEDEMIRLQKIVVQKMDTTEYSFMQHANFYFPLFKEKDDQRGEVFTDEDLGGTAFNTRYYVYRFDISLYNEMFGFGWSPFHKMIVRMGRY